MRLGLNLITIKFPVRCDLVKLLLYDRFFMRRLRKNKKARILKNKEK